MKKTKKPTTPVVESSVQSAINSPQSLKRWLMLICGLCAFLLYANTLTHDYVLDDETAIVKNNLTQEGISAIPEIFSTPYRAGFDDRKEGLYRPLSIAFFAIEWEIAPDNPHLSHWVNVLLYVLTVLMLFITLSLFFESKNVLLPFIATLLFTTHPIHSEVVANIKSRDEILCFLFSLISLWAIVKYAKQNDSIYLAIAGIAVFLGMLSKETAVTMVVLAPLTVFFFSRLTAGKIAITAVPFIAAFVAYLTLRISVLKGLSNFEEIQIINNSLVGAGDDTLTRLATAISIIGRYLWLLMVPHPLSFDYSYNTIPLVSLSDPKTLIAMLVIVGLAVIAFKGLKSRNPISWGIIFMGATLFLVSNILFLIEATLGERFLYMPSLGFCVGISFLFARIFKSNQSYVSYKSISGFISANKAIFSVVIVITILYGMKTISRNADWKNNLTLVQVDSKTNPNSVRIRYAYGSILVMEKALIEKDARRKSAFLNEGIRQLTEAVKILPDYSSAWFNLGMGYKELEDYQNAILCFDNARKYSDKEDVQLYIASGVAYGEDKQYQKAFELLNKAIQLDSASEDAYNNIGLFYSRAGNYSLSLQMLNKAMQLNPTDYHPPFNMGNTYADMGDFKTAVEYYQKALSLDPNSDIVWVNLGNSYGMLKDYPNALKAFEKAMQLNPSNENARYNTGTTYFLMGDTVTAKKYLPKE